MTRRRIYTLSRVQRVSVEIFVETSTKPADAVAAKARGRMVRARIDFMIGFVFFAGTRVVRRGGIAGHRARLTRRAGSGHWWVQVRCWPSEGRSGRRQS